MARPETRSDSTELDRTQEVPAEARRPDPLGRDGDGPDRPDDRPPLLEPRRALPRGAVLTLVAAVAVLAVALAANLFTGALDRVNPFRDGLVEQRTVDRSGPAVLQAITDLGEFRAASGYYELVVDLEKDVGLVPSFLAGERVLFVAAGSVDAAVDLRGLTGDAVAVDATRTSATITLPRPRMTAPRLDPERSYVYDRNRGVVNRVRDAVAGNPNDQQELYALANRRLAEAAEQTPELRTRGEANTRSMLEGLLRSLGFTSVEVRFA